MKSQFYPAIKFSHACLTLFLVALSFISNAQQVARSTTFAGNTIGFYEYKPANYDNTIKYPLIIFLHGIGERGNGTTQLNFVLAQGIPRYINEGETMTFTNNGITKTFLVLSPQLASNFGSWQNFYIDAMLDWATHNLSVDPNRIYLTGLSLGGGGTWKYVMSSQNAQKFAAIAPVCGTCDWWNDGLCELAHANTAVWAFHAQDDNQVPVSCTNDAINIMNGCNPAPSITPIKTIYPAGVGGHFIWDRAYDRTHNIQNPNLFEWFISRSRSTDPCINNLPPIAEAGNNLTIQEDHYMLNSWGSRDQDGGSITYLWTNVSGPTTPEISGNIYAVANVSGLVPGVYVFKLKVTDNCGAIAEDQIEVTVQASNCNSNLPPLAEAGNNLTIHEDHYMLSSWGSRDQDGGTITFLWTNVSGPTTPTISGNIYATANVAGLVEGVYVFKLKVTDNCGAIAEDQIEVTVDLPVTRSNQVTESVSNEKLYHVYPNPATNRLFIDINGTIHGKIKVTLADLSGRTVRTLEVQQSALKNGLDLSGLKSGVYLLHLENNGSKYTQKVIRK